MNVETDTIKLSIHYASYLVNGDDSSLTFEEVEQIDQWLERDQRDRPYYIVDVSEEYDFDLDPISLLMSEVAEYTIIYR
jgi:hypothetical protein